MEGIKPGRAAEREEMDERPEPHQGEQREP
jgi:hypothetical protein